MTFQPEAARKNLQAFDLKRLFINDLGWNNPANRSSIPLAIHDTSFILQPIAALGGVQVFEVTSIPGGIPDSKTRAAVHKEAAKISLENLLVFLTANRTQSLWYWVKRDGTRRIPREHVFTAGQSGDLFLGKLGPMFVDISDLDEKGNLPVLQAARLLQDALDVERVTKQFFSEFARLRLQFTNLIEGIASEADRKLYASILLNRLMFIYFLQGKGFLAEGNHTYLQDRLTEWGGPESYDFFRDFLRILFFEGFAKPENDRSDEAKHLLHGIRYINGGLFLEHPIERNNPGLRIPNLAFQNLLNLFSAYTWNLNDTPGGNDQEINPDVLGYIFEKYINQKSFGAYYTRPQITEYLSEHAIYRLVLNQVNNTIEIPGVLKNRHFESMEDMLVNLDADLCKALIFTILPNIKLLDPACGSGAFLVAAMKTLINIYSAAIGRIEFVADRDLTEWLAKARREHKSLAYYIKRRIITDNLFGVDLMPEAAEIARLRLFLALVSSVNTVDQLEPLPNIDFNILPGNSLIGLLRVDENQFNNHGNKGMQVGLFQPSYRQVVKAKAQKLSDYRDGSQQNKLALETLRDEIAKMRKEAVPTLNELLLDEFSRLKIKKEDNNPDHRKKASNKNGKPSVQILDIETLTPFHWGFEFDDVMNDLGGFDAILTNPPWDIFKPNAKEFFEQHSDLVTKKKMRIEEFEKEQSRLLQDSEIRRLWYDYQDSFPHQSAYYRTAEQFKNQISVIDGKKAGTDINLYKLFLEQCYNLLRPGGQCGIVLPGGIYSDMGAKQLREMLFSKTEITGLFGFENRKEIFEGVHRSFKFVVLTFEKGGTTVDFPAAFMRHDVADLAAFPAHDALHIPVKLVKRVSPTSLSIMEFKSGMDIQIAEKMLHFPLLGEHVEDAWNISLTREFDMTNDSYLFKTQPAPNRLPLFEGKMIWQFDSHYAEPRYWVEETEGRRAVLGRHQDTGQTLGYQGYRLGLRAIARNTDTRTIICSALPKLVYCGNSVLVTSIFDENNNSEMGLCFAVCILNSFCLEFYIRNLVSANINMFFLYQMPVPRLTMGDTFFAAIVERAARLICISPEFESLLHQIGTYLAPAIELEERAQIRAELDAMVAHLYGLTEMEFKHILSSFPLVKEEVKQAALQEYRKL